MTARAPEAPPRTIIRVLVVIGAAFLLLGTGLAVAQHRRIVTAPPVEGRLLHEHHSFVPYALVLAAAPFLVLAAGLAAGGVRFHRSGTAEHADPERMADGWFAVEPFRPYLSLRDSAFAGSAALAAVSAPALGHYFSVVDAPVPGAVLTALVLAALFARFLWGGVRRTWAGGRLEQAALAIKPELPRAGAAFTVRVTQSAKSPITIRAFDVTLVCERRETKLVSGASKTRTTTTIIVRARARLPIDRFAAAGEPITAEHTFAVPASATATGAAFLRWRVELRTRIAGPDYETHFPIAG